VRARAPRRDCPGPEARPPPWGAGKCPRAGVGASDPPVAPLAGGLGGPAPGEAAGRWAARPCSAPRLSPLPLLQPCRDVA